MRKQSIVLCCFLLFAGACATITPMSDSEVYSKFESIADLDKKIQSAIGNEVNILAPAGFRQAKDLLERAMENARKDEKEKAKLDAQKGVEVLDQAEKDAERARDIMWEVLEYRERARKVGAQGVFKEEFRSVERRFRDATRLVERDQEDAAKDRRPALLESYSELEVRTVKEGTIAIAKASFKEAKALDADDYARKTFKRAEKELDLATSTLEADPTQQEKANLHAKRSDNLSLEAVQITELAKIFDRRDYSHEDIILWYQQQLSDINKPLKSDLNFTQPNRKVVGSMHDTIASLVQSQKDDLQIIEKQQKYIEELNARIADERKKYEARLSAQAKKQAERERREAEAKHRFEYVQSLFSAEEAEVFRQGNNVLISAAGFYFPVGGTEILAKNFGLLNKVINSIHQFPTSRVKISGHTDSMGSTEMNLKLSQARANNVAKFLKDVGNIEQDRITAEGYGEAKPVASNKTANGRAKNRRIEVLIINK